MFENNKTLEISVLLYVTKKLTRIISEILIRKLRYHSKNWLYLLLDLLFYAYEVGSKSLLTYNLVWCYILAISYGIYHICFVV